MGSKARVVLYAQSEEAAAKIAGEAFAVMNRLDAVLSDYRDDSEAMRLTRDAAGEWRPISRDLLGVLDLSDRVWSASRGAFDVSVGPMTQRWRKSRDEGTLPSDAELNDLRARVGFGTILIDRLHSRVKLPRDGMRLDFGGVGKGYAAQAAVDRMSDLGYNRCLAEIGGDLAVGSPPPGESGWRITIETGLRESDRKTLRLHHAGVATSGDAVQFVEIGGVRYSHLVNPQTGLGLTERIAVTVVADQKQGGGGMADAAASAISVLGADEGRAFAERMGVKAYIVHGE